MSEEDFTTTGINRDLETILDEESKVGKTPDSKAGQVAAGKKAQEDLDRGRTTLQKLADKGLNPLKNGDSIFLVIYSLLLSALIQRIERGNYNHIEYIVGFGLLSLLALILTEKGHLQVMLRQVWLVTLTRIGAKAEVKKGKQEDNRSIIQKRKN